MAPSINIYINDSLKQRLDNQKEKINCSEVARKAFEQELEAVEAIDESVDEAAIRRLKKSKHARLAEIERQGRVDGEKYAREVADWYELDELARVFGSDARVSSPTISDYVWLWKDHFTDEFEYDDALDEAYASGALQRMVQLYDQLKDKV